MKNKQNEKKQKKTGILAIQTKRKHFALAGVSLGVASLNACETLRLATARTRPKRSCATAGQKVGRPVRTYTV